MNLKFLNRKFTFITPAKWKVESGKLKVERGKWKGESGKGEVES